MKKSLKEKIGNIFGIIAFVSSMIVITYIFTFGLLFLIFWLMGAILSNYLIIILLLVAIPVSFVFFIIFLVALVFSWDSVELDTIKKLKAKGSE